MNFQRVPVTMKKMGECTEVRHMILVFQEIQGHPNLMGASNDRADRTQSPDIAFGVLSRDTDDRCNESTRVLVSKKCKLYFWRLSGRGN